MKKLPPLLELLAACTTTTSSCCCECSYVEMMHITTAGLTSLLITNFPAALWKLYLEHYRTADTKCHLLKMFLKRMQQNILAAPAAAAAAVCR